MSSHILGSILLLMQPHNESIFLSDAYSLLISGEAGPDHVTGLSLALEGAGLVRGFPVGLAQPRGQPLV